MTSFKKILVIASVLATFALAYRQQVPVKVQGSKKDPQNHVDVKSLYGANVSLIQVDEIDTTPKEFTDASGNGQGGMTEEEKRQQESSMSSMMWVIMMCCCIPFCALLLFSMCRRRNEMQNSNPFSENRSAMLNAYGNQNQY